MTQTADFVCLSIRSDGQTKSTKDRYLMSFLSNKKRIFKIGLLEPSEVETDPLKTDGHGFKYRYLGSYLSNKKRNFENPTVKTYFGGGDTDRETDGHLADVKTYFLHFLNSFELKKESRLNIMSI